MRLQNMLPAALSFLISFHASASSPNGPEAPDGFWLTEDKTTIVEIMSCEETSLEYCGFIRALPGAANDPELARYEDELCGLPLLHGLVYDSQHKRWSGGKLFDPETERSYDAYMKVKGGTLEVRAHEGKETLGETLVWTRAPRPDESCSAK